MRMHTSQNGTQKDDVVIDSNCNSRCLSRALIVITVITFFIALATRGVWSPYSYSSDELFSVATSNASWSAMFEKWIIPDTHPPLYPVLLKFWIIVNGISEPSTRSLSVLTAIMTLIMGAYYTRQRSFEHQLAVIIVLGSSPLFAYYSQETRNYSLLIFTATMAVGSALELRAQRIANATHSSTKSYSLLECAHFLSALLLSLTHYFGWLLFFVLTLGVTAEGVTYKRRWHGFALFCCGLIWPTFHVLASSFTEKAERVSWIRVEPIIGTLQQFAGGVLTFLEYARYSLPVIVILVALAVYATGAKNIWRYAGKPSDSMPLEASEIRLLFSIIFCFVIMVMIIDLRSPMSTTRNYVVLLPCLAYLVGNILAMARMDRSKMRTFVWCNVIAAMVFMSIYKGESLISEKIYPELNYKSLGAYVVDSGLCDKGCWSTGSGPQYDIYFGNKKLLLLDLGSPLSQQNLSLPLLGFQGASDHLPQLHKSNPGKECWQPHQGWDISTFVFIDKSTYPSPDKYGFSKCSPA